MEAKMANVDNNNYIGGTQYAGKDSYIESFLVGTGDSTAIGLGAFVTPVGTTATYSVNGQTYPTVAKAGTADAILGRVVGVDPITDSSKIYREASTERLVFVNTDPDQIFEIQADDTVVAGDIGLNANIVDSSAVGALGRQQEEIDISTKATTATLQLKMLGIAQKSDNEVGAYAKIVAKINNHARSNNQAAGV